MKTELKQLTDTRDAILKVRVGLKEGAPGLAYIGSALSALGAAIDNLTAYADIIETKAKPAPQTATPIEH